MRHVLVLLAALVVGCEPAEECFAYDVDGGAPGLNCEQVDICCDKGTPAQCAYVTQRDERYECLSEVDCGAAARDLVCDVCDIGEATAPYVGCG